MDEKIEYRSRSKKVREDYGRDTGEIRDKEIREGRRG